MKDNWNVCQPLSSCHGYHSYCVLKEAARPLFLPALHRTKLKQCPFLYEYGEAEYLHYPNAQVLSYA